MDGEESETESEDDGEGMEWEWECRGEKGLENGVWESMLERNDDERAAEKLKEVKGKLERRAFYFDRCEEMCWSF